MFTIHPLHEPNVKESDNWIQGIYIENPVQIEKLCGYADNIEFNIIQLDLLHVSNRDKQKHKQYKTKKEHRNRNTLFHIQIFLFKHKIIGEWKGKIKN